MSAPQGRAQVRVDPRQPAVERYDYDNGDNYPIVAEKQVGDEHRGLASALAQNAVPQTFRRQIGKAQCDYSCSRASGDL
jgi:hypothetical protein